jgi:YafQ family addiction module toxin component
MYSLYVKPTADKIFFKLSSKNPKLCGIVDKKITQIRQRPFGYKPLRGDLAGFYRVHVDSHFVLIFDINHNEKSITVYFFGHHDEVYLWRPK